MTAATSFNTIGAVISQAYQNAGLTGVGQFPVSEQIADALNRMNGITNFLQTRGLKLFTYADVPMTLTSTNFYPVGPGQSGISMTKPLRVENAYFVAANTVARIPLTPLSWQEWTTLPVSTTIVTGQPVNYLVDKQENFLGLYLWPTPDSTSQTGAVHWIFQQQVPLGQAITDDMGFPPEWKMVLTWSLAEELAVGQPAEIVSFCSNRAAFYREALEGWDVEDAQTFLTPDPRGQYYGNSFR